MSDNESKQDSLPGDYKPGDMLSTSEAAKYLGISRQRLNVLLKQKRVPGAYQMNNKIWIIPFDGLSDMPERKPGNPHDGNSD